MKIVAVIGGMLVMVIVGVAGYNWYQMKQLQKQELSVGAGTSSIDELTQKQGAAGNVNSPSVNQPDVDDDQMFEVLESDEGAEQSNKLEDWRQVIKELNEWEQLRADDSRWLRYTNEKLKFTIKVPKSILSLGCNGEELTPMGFFSYKKGSDSVVKLAPYFLYKKQDGKCTKQKNSLGELMKKDNFGILINPTWRITMADIANRKDLDKFANYQYGSDDVSCAVRSLGTETRTFDNSKKKPLPEGVYDVQVGALPLEKQYNYPICGGGYASFFLYDKVAQKAVQWDLGQDSNFSDPSSKMDSFDLEMVASFQFLR